MFLVTSLRPKARNSSGVSSSGTRTSNPSPISAPPPCLVISTNNDDSLFEQSIIHWSINRYSLNNQSIFLPKEELFHMRKSLRWDIFLTNTTQGGYWMEKVPPWEPRIAGKRCPQGRQSISSVLCFSRTGFWGRVFLWKAGMFWCWEITSNAEKCLSGKKRFRFSWLSSPYG